MRTVTQETIDRFIELEESHEDVVRRLVEEQPRLMEYLHFVASSAAETAAEMAETHHKVHGTYPPLESIMAGIYMSAAVTTYLLLEMEGRADEKN